MNIALTKTFAALKPKVWDRKPIKNPGIYSDIPIDVYHSANICVAREPALSSSGMRKLYSPFPWVKASPAHYWMHSPYNPHRVEHEDEKPWLILGRAAHHLLFGEKEFDEVFAKRPDTVNGFACNLRTKHGKAWYDEQKERGLTVVTKDQLRAVHGIARELKKEPLIWDPEEKRSGILNGLIEHSWIWKHRNGLWLKVRPDATPTDSLDFVDLKVTSSVMWPDMVRKIRDLGYFMQAGLTAMAVKNLLGQTMNSYTLVFCEATEPHCIEIVTLKEEDINRGWQACETAISKFTKCWNEKRWPGPRGDRADAQYIEMTEFDQNRIDEAIALERKNDA